jgi:hypothetical protein
MNKWILLLVCALLFVAYASDAHHESDEEVCVGFCSLISLRDGFFGSLDPIALIVTGSVSRPGRIELDESQPR